MANTITGYGNINFNGMPYTANFTVNETLGTSSIVQAQAGVLAVSASTWQQLNTGSVIDVGHIYIDNVNGPGTIQIAKDSAGATLYGTLSPTDWMWMSWTGSAIVWYRATDTSSRFNYIITSN